MNNINLTIRMDKTLKSQFEKFCNAVGLNITTAFNIFAKQCVKEQKIPFEISTKSNVTVLTDEELKKITVGMIDDNNDIFEELSK